MQAKQSLPAHCGVLTAVVEGDTLRVEVRDDGIGGAETDGSGIVGLAGRITAFDGPLWVETPPGGAP